MRKVIVRKIYMSILATLLVLSTTIATTFAWVGMLNTATFGGFTMNLKIEDHDSPYFLTISSVDSINREAYSSSTALIDVQKQIMDNMGINYSDKIDSTNSAAVNSYFYKNVKLSPVSTGINANGNKLTNFYSMADLNKGNTDLYESNSYFKFDVYLSVDVVEGIQATTEVNANVFLEHIADCITGTLTTSALLNGNPFTNPTYIPSSVYDPFNVLPSFNPNSLTIDSKNATRIAFEIYNPIALADSYSNYPDSSPREVKIYQGGSKIPYVSNGIYDFGGILPEDYNLAIQELNRVYDKKLKLDNAKIKSNNLPFLGAYKRFNQDVDLEMNDNYIYQQTTDIVDSSNFSSYYILSGGNYVTPTSYNSSDIYYSRVKNNSLWKSPKESMISTNNYLGIHNGVQTKMKLTIYFWFEGFDADCFQFIDHKNVDINLTFSTGKDE